MAKLKTGRHTSALKEARKAVKRAARNTSIMSDIKTSIKKVAAFVEKKDVKAASEEARKASSKLDKAAKKHIIHRKNASNHKSKLHKKLSSIQK
ncbi:MAG: 30S ribosomal protein S20 [Elusimicrobiota bacterium]|jgi:small subunit ribosomal protein S20|nr:30S ribosomal protein S20 [Elusimicrobiota bacterium]